jgi:hypothetical protein
MDDHIANREMMMTGVFIALTICALVWQVLRTLSRGALDGRSVLRLAVSLFALGIMLYVGHTIFSMWT